MKYKRTMIQMYLNSIKNVLDLIQAKKKMLKSSSFFCPCRNENFEQLTQNSIINGNNFRENYQKMGSLNRKSMILQKQKTFH